MRTPPRPPVEAAAAELVKVLDVIYKAARATRKRRNDLRQRHGGKDAAAAGENEDHAALLASMRWVAEAGWPRATPPLRGDARLDEWVDTTKSTPSSPLRANRFGLRGQPGPPSATSAWLDADASCRARRAAAAEVARPASSGAPAKAWLQRLAAAETGPILTTPRPRGGPSNRSVQPKLAGLNGPTSRFYRVHVDDATSEWQPPGRASSSVRDGMS